MRKWIISLIVFVLILAFSKSHSQDNLYFQDDNSVNVPGWSTGQVKEPSLGQTVTYLGDLNKWSIWQVTKGEYSRPACHAIRAGDKSKAVSPSLIHIGGALNGTYSNTGVHIQLFKPNGTIDPLLSFYGREGDDKNIYRRVSDGKLWGHGERAPLSEFYGAFEYEVSSCRYPSIFSGCHTQRDKITFNNVFRIVDVLTECALKLP